MTNNYLLRRLRYIFDYDDSTMTELFNHGREGIIQDQIGAWLAPEKDDNYQSCSDQDMAHFLNGLIEKRRGKKEGATPTIESELNNNIIFRKLKIALDFQAEEVIKVMQCADFTLSKHELSAFFRRTDHKHYRECKDQIIRNFLNGLQSQFRPETPVGVKSVWNKTK